MVVTIDGIPVYNAVISDDDTGMFKISLVDEPAVMSNFVAFDKAKRPLMYSIANEEKRIVRGVVMRADFPIYRYDKDWGEYYIIYKADTIRQMAEKYLLESRQNDVNLMHEDNSDVDGVQMVQYFIKDTNAGVNPTGFEEIADGSLFAEFHIVNDEVWEQVKDGTFKGYSLEGVFDLVPEQDEEKVESIVDSLEGKFNKLFNNFNMSKFKKFMARLSKALVEFANVTTDKGILVWDGDDDLKAGDAVYVEDAEGNRTPAEDGDYKTEDGKVIKVVEGKVSEITDAEAEVEPVEEQELASIATDNGELLYDGELEVGTEVFVADAEGNQTPAPDGDYVTEDGKVIKVAEGKVAEIVEPETTEEETPEENEEVNALKAENESLKSEVAELKKQVAELKKKPLAKPAHEEVVTTFKIEKTGDKGIDRLASRFAKR